MADTDDLLAGVLPDKAAVPEVAPEITATDRLILNNVFDTQPAKRAAYLRQKGFEMNPKDDNMFRPIGSKGAYVGKIDPSFHEAFTKGGLHGLVKEAALDLGDIGFDTGIAGLTTGLGASEGAAAGGAAGAAAGPVGAGIGAILGGISAGVLSGAASNAAGETLKAGIGSILLDENIPHDYKATAIQSFMAGAAPMVLQGAGKAVNRLVMKSQVNSVVEGIQNAARKFGSNLTPEILQTAAKKPEIFSPENTAKVGEAMNKQYATIFGINPEKAQLAKRVDQVTPKSVIGQAIAPLNQAADTEMTKLSANPAANFSLRDILDSFQKVRGKIESTGIATEGEEAGLKQVDKYQSQVMQMAEKNLRKQGVQGPLSPSQLLDAPLDFSQVRTISKKMKDAAMDENVHGAEMLAQIAGSGEGQIGSQLTKKANAVGSNWNAIQSQRHDLLDLHNRAQEILKPTALENAFLGDQTNSGKNRAQALLSEMDAKTGTNLSQNVKDSNAQRAFAQFYANPDVYAQGNPLLQKTKEVSSLLADFKFGSATKALMNNEPKIKRGQNLAQLFADKLDRAKALDQSYAAPMRRTAPTALAGIEASKLYQPELEQAAPPEAQASSGAGGGDDLYAALLQGVK